MLHLHEGQYIDVEEALALIEKYGIASRVGRGLKFSVMSEMANSVLSVDRLDDYRIVEYIATRPDAIRKVMEGRETSVPPKVIEKMLAGKQVHADDARAFAKDMGVPLYTMYFAPATCVLVNDVAHIPMEKKKVYHAYEVFEECWRKHKSPEELGYRVYVWHDYYDRGRPAPTQEAQALAQWYTPTYYVKEEACE